MSREILGCLCALLGSWLHVAQVDAAPLKSPMNLVVILTDDQRVDTLWAMPNVQSKLVTRGVTFNNAYVPTPLCCPSRAAMYSGGYYAKNTGVYSNGVPNGGAAVFNDKANMGAVLQGAGYQTFFAGKWLNQYSRLGAHVPPGWNKFVGARSDATGASWSSFTYVIGTSYQSASTGTTYTAAGQYNADYERGQVLDFLSNAPTSKPFFVFWSACAPHQPATPAAQDTGLFPTYSFRGRGYGETDLSDKPLWVRNNTQRDSGDTFTRKQLRSLQSVDRGVAAIVDKVAAMGQLDNTVFIFASDNGYMWGEHGLWGKNKPYEEALRVPMVVVLPGVKSRSDDHLVSASLDLGPTLYELAGVPRQSDGMSLVPLLKNPAAVWRNDLFFEKNISGNHANSLWAGVRNERWKYIKYWNGEEELYDLINDPYELTSRHKDSTLSTIKSTLASQTTKQLGMAIMPLPYIPKGVVNTSYSVPFKVWGGVAPFTWKLASGQIPPGLALNASTGVLQGVPRTAGNYKFSIRLTDSSLATQAQKARTFVEGPMTLTVTP